MARERGEDGEEHLDFPDPSAPTPRRRRKRAADNQQMNNMVDPNSPFPPPPGDGQPPPNVASMYPPGHDPQAFLQQRPGDLPGPPGFVGDRMGFHTPDASSPSMYPPPRRLDDVSPHLMRCTASLKAAA